MHYENGPIKAQFLYGGFDDMEFKAARIHIGNALIELPNYAVEFLGRVLDEISINGYSGEHSLNIDDVTLSIHRSDDVITLSAKDIKWDLDDKAQISVGQAGDFCMTLLSVAENKG
jgi:hypothetical protein